MRSNGDYSEPLACAGESIRETIEHRIDEEVDYLMDPDLREKGGDDYLLAKGTAQGLTSALALLISPYDPEAAEVAIRADSVRRYEQRTSTST